MFSMNRSQPAQLNALLQYASQALGVPADQLADAVSGQHCDELANTLSPESRRKLESLTSDPSQLQALLDSPQVKHLLARLSK